MSCQHNYEYAKVSIDNIFISYADLHAHLPFMNCGVDERGRIESIEEFM
jgi:hypothetical protein